MSKTESVSFDVLNKQIAYNLEVNSRRHLFRLVKIYAFVIAVLLLVSYVNSVAPLPYYHGLILMIIAIALMPLMYIQLHLNPSSQPASPEHLDLISKYTFHNKAGHDIFLLKTSEGHFATNNDLSELLSRESAYLNRQNWNSF